MYLRTLKIGQWLYVDIYYQNLNVHLRQYKFISRHVYFSRHKQEGTGFFVKSRPAIAAAAAHQRHFRKSIKDRENIDSVVISSTVFGVS